MLSCYFFLFTINIKLIVLVRNFLAWNSIGFLLYNAKYIKEAENAFKKAITILPEYVDAHVNLFHLCKSDERLDDAKKYLEIAKSLAPDNDEVKLMEV